MDTLYLWDEFLENNLSRTSSLDFTSGKSSAKRSITKSSRSTKKGLSKVTPTRKNSPFKTLPVRAALLAGSLPTLLPGASLPKNNASKAKLAKSLEIVLQLQSMVDTLLYDSQYKSINMVLSVTSFLFITIQRFLKPNSESKTSKKPRLSREGSPRTLRLLDEDEESRDSDPLEEYFFSFFDFIGLSIHHDCWQEMLGQLEKYSQMPSFGKESIEPLMQSVDCIYVKRHLVRQRYYKQYKTLDSELNCL